MNITLFSNSSGTNVLNKSLTQLSNGIVGDIKDESNIVNPEIIVSNTVNTNYPNFNYFYIDKFDRYYYVTDKTTEHGRLIIHGHVDVLQSFNSDIKSLTIVPTRSSGNYDLYLDDNQIPIDNYRIIASKAFTGSFNEHHYILSCCG